MRAALILCLLPLAAPLPAHAEPPRVVADIPPVAALVSAVLGEEVAPLVGPGDDPHHFQLRPSQARELADAQAVFWIGEELTPWLSGVIASAAPGADSVSLTGTVGMHHRPFLFGGDPDEAGSDDPHVWLDPGNDLAMLMAISSELARLDPGGASGYRERAAEAARQISEADTRAKALLEPYHASRLIVFHDAYAHYADAYGLTIAGAVADGEAAEPGAAALADLRAKIAKDGADCILTEPQHSPKLAESLASDTGVPVHPADPLRAESPGDWLVSMAEAISQCLGG